jgi:hypothetical protein
MTKLTQAPGTKFRVPSSKLRVYLIGYDFTKLIEKETYSDFVTNFIIQIPIN